MKAKLSNLLDSESVAKMLCLICFSVLFMSFLHLSPMTDIFMPCFAIPNSGKLVSIGVIPFTFGMVSYSFIAEFEELSKAVPKTPRSNHQNILSLFRNKNKCQLY